MLTDSGQPSAARPPSFHRFPNWLTVNTEGSTNDITRCAISPKFYNASFSKDKYLQKDAYSGFFEYLQTSLKDRGFRQKDPIRYRTSVPPWLSRNMTFFENETGETLSMLPIPHIPEVTLLVSKAEKGAICGIIAV